MSLSKIARLRLVAAAKPIGAIASFAMETRL